MSRLWDVGGSRRSAADLIKRRLGITDTSNGPEPEWFDRAIEAEHRRKSSEGTRPAREEETQPLTNAAGLITDPAGALSAAISGDTSKAVRESIASLLRRELEVIEGRNE